jgi:hypothetical protein
MRTRFSAFVMPLAVATTCIGLLACGGPKSSAGSRTPPPPVTKDKFTTALRCDATKPGYELSYHDLAGKGRSDMVEVLAFTRTAGGTSEGRVVCMEVDTNHDGALDLIRIFDEAGAIEAEEADRNYDGKSDVWVNYEKGYVVKQSFDTRFQGKQDEFHYYNNGKLKRIERDRNYDGKVDVWEFYVNDRLERMGVDLDFNGKVDIWYRDEVARAQQAKTSGPAAPSASASAAPSASAKKKSGEAE